MQPIITPQLILRFPQLEDESFLIAFDDRNRSHLARWESTTKIVDENDYSLRLRKWLQECEEEMSARFFIFMKNNPQQIIGMCHFTQIFRGPFQACYLGYKIDREFEGKGLMFEALQNTIQFIFEGLNLHRIMANYMPHNTKSEKLLKRLGFVVEGYAKNYLLINNKWEDHVLTSLTNERWI